MWGMPAASPAISTRRLTSASSGCPARMSCQGTRPSPSGPPVTMAPSRGSNTASKAGSACTGRLMVRHQALKGSSPRLVRGHDEAGDHLLLPRVVEPDDQRSEEHTSELQSLMRISYAVFCLQKKKIPLHTTHLSNISTPR